MNDSNADIPGNLQSTSKSLSTKPEVPAPRIEWVNHEQRLETAYLQTAEEVSPGSLNHSKPERNQVLPQVDVYYQNQMDFTDPASLTSQHWEDELKEEFSALKIYDVQEATQFSQAGPRFDLYPMSPSLLHNRSYVSHLSKEST